MKLSVLMVTYNHEKFIEQAVRSALMQKTNFDFEIVIGEDCSTDSTREIVRRLEAENPGKVRVLYNQRNMGMHLNHRNVYFNCKGQYIAILEGDDYWLSPEKLQRQVNFLDAHPECSLCFHNVLVYHDNDPENESVFCPPNQKEISDIEDILEMMFVPSGGVVMRNGLFKEFPQLGLDLLMGDWPFFIFMATFGKLGYINEVMGVYRKHSEGGWNRITPQQRIASVTKMYADVDAFLGGRYHDLIQVLARRWAFFMDCDGDRRHWKKKAQDAEKRIAELEESRRAMKKQLADLTKQLESAKQIV